MNTKILILIAVLISFIACENKETEFDDFGTTACYFPFQTPARTLILGKYELGLNDNDNNHAFEIGVTMGGVYKNTQNRMVHFRLAPELLDSVSNVVILPSSHYTIVTSSPVTIPSGSIKGRILVQLNEQFFNDSLSFAPLNSVNYLIPLLITQAENLDTILSGQPVVSNPTLVKEEDWEIQPKNYTLFGIKFINKYHAMYLRRGADTETNLSSGISETSVYRQNYVEKDELVMLTTTGKNSVRLSNSSQIVNMELLFDDNGNCTVQSLAGDTYNATGTGKFVENGDSWGGKPRDVIYLQYTYDDTANNSTHVVNDTLVVRDRNVIFETFSVQLIN